MGQNAIYTFNHRQLILAKTR